jgi:WD40 repeat protein
MRIDSIPNALYPSSLQSIGSSKENNNRITLISSEHDIFSLSGTCAMRSCVLSAMLTSRMQEGIANTIHFPSIDTRTLSVISLLLQVTERQRSSIATALAKEYCSDHIIKITNAAEYLDIQEYLNIQYISDVTPILYSAAWYSMPISTTTSYVDNPVTSLVIIDGDLVVSGLHDNTISIHHIQTNRCFHLLSGHTAWITFIAVDEDIVVSGSWDESVKVWDKKTGICLHTMQGHTGVVHTGVIDGNRIMSGSSDATIRIWDKEKGNSLHLLEGHTNGVMSLVVDKDLIVSGSRDTTIRMWDKYTGDCLRILPGHTQVICAVIVDEAWIISGAQDATLRIWDKYTGSELHILATESTRIIKSLKVDKGIIVLKFYDGIVKEWNTMQHKRFHEFITHLPLVYVSLFQIVHTAMVKDTQVSITVPQQEIANHFFETVRDNWGAAIERRIKVEFNKFLKF